jgi:ADP-heptose:LPS heptosyltransferase
MGVPIVAIFGPTIYKRNAPWMVPHRIVRKKLACSPCYRFSKIDCEDYKCLELVSVEDVLKSLTELCIEQFSKHRAEEKNLYQTGLRI